MLWTNAFLSCYFSLRLRLIHRLIFPHAKLGHLIPWSSNQPLGRPSKLYLSVQFTALFNAPGFNLIAMTVEAHWSLIVNRYYNPLHWIFQELLLKHSQALLSLIFAFGNLSVCHTAGSEVFGAEPRPAFRNYEEEPQTGTNRMDLMQIARQK